MNNKRKLVGYNKETHPCQLDTCHVAKIQGPNFRCQVHSFFHTCKNPGALSHRSRLLVSQVRSQNCSLWSHQHPIPELCPMLSDTLIAVLFPGLRSHTELEKSLVEGTTGRRFLVGLSERFSLSQLVKKPQS